jgi:hypothetical protein
MVHTGPTRRRARLRGWLRYTPFLLVPFSVFGAETWLHHARIQDDYQASSIRRELSQVNARIDELTDDIARLERLDRMNSKAPDLGLVPAAPDQLRVVNLPRDGSKPKANRHVELAQLDIIDDELLMGSAHIE